MAQAKTIPSTSRRKFLAAAAVASVAATPVIAAGQDGRLIELGKRFDEIDRGYWAAVARVRPLELKHKELMADWVRKHPHRSSDETTAEYRRLWDAVGLNDSNHPDNWSAKIGPVADEIMSIPAATMAGLSVKARLARSQASHLWESREADADWADLVVRKLVDAVLQLAASHTSPVTI